MRKNINKQKFTTYGLSLFLMISVLFGVFNLGSIGAQANNLLQEPQAIHIEQGDFITFQIVAGEQLEFGLDVISPIPRESFNWTVEQPPDLGEAVLSGVGGSARVTYFSNPLQGGQDRFVILVTSSTGQRARTTIAVSLEQQPAFNDMYPPAEDRWIGPSFQSQEPVEADSLTREADPKIAVNPQYDWVYGYHWPAGVEVTLSVDAVQWTGTATSWGGVSFDTGGFNFRPGLVLVMTDGTYERTHTVANLSVTAIDQENNTLTGTAEPNQGLVVIAEIAHNNNYEDKRIETIADGSGTWEVDFTGHINITQGTYGWVVQYDQQGNWTEINWSIPNPYITADLLENSVFGGDWLPNTAVSLSIGRYRWGSISGYGGWVWIFTNPVNLIPGQVLEMTDGTNTRSLTVANLAVTMIDEANNTLRGTADKDQQIQVYAANYDKGQGQFLFLTADGTGEWVADFSEYVAIEPGAEGWVMQTDPAGNNTRIRWFMPDPYLLVSGRHGVLGRNWTPGAQVTLTIGANQWVRTADANGYLNVVTHPFTIQPGQVLTMSDDTHQVQYTMPNLAITDIDQEQDTISGTADPSLTVNVSANDKFGEFMRIDNVPVDAAGNWSADFSESDVVISPGSYIIVDQTSNDRNGALIFLSIADPWITVLPEANSVEGWDWTPGAEATLTINANQWTSTVYEWGGVFFNLDTYDIQAGDVVQLTDGIDSRTHTVANLALPEIDEVENTLSGTGDPNTVINVWVVDKVGRIANYSLKTDGAGVWFTDFYGRLDIGPGTRGEISHRDVAGSGTTRIDWFIPDPFVEVSIVHDYIYGTMWPPNETITLDVNGNQWTTTTSRQGFFYISTAPFKLLPGQAITVSGGGYTVSYEPWTIEITDINYETDVKTVIAHPPNAAAMRSIGLIEIEVQACDSGICATQFIEMDMTGSWEVDFGGVIDLKPGTSSGSARSRDDSAGSTFVSWQDFVTYLPLINR